MKENITQTILIILCIHELTVVQSLPSLRLYRPNQQEMITTKAQKNTDNNEVLMKSIQPEWESSGKLNSKKSINYDFNNYAIKPTFYQYVKSCCNREVMRPMGGGHLTGPCCRQLIKFNRFIRLSFPWFKQP
ncbi:unnamed protein product [Heterobilharzia americana]|nr:unnamed protein product [Heterobilharzia americana]